MRTQLVAVAALAIACTLGLGLVPSADAGPLRERIAERLRERRMASADAVQQALPPGSSVQRDIAYGPDPAQRYDVYRPARPDGRVLVMVHGGGWSRGDKAMESVVDNKVAHWVSQGVTFVSVNYRLLPGAAVPVQARDVASAVADVQRRAPGWGASAEHLVLVGHSAGAHLVGLIAADPAAFRDTPLAPWRATVTLDSAAIDVPMLMSQPHMSLYDDAFGTDPAFWRANSPLQQLSVRTTPTLLVCSSNRGDDSCGPAGDFARRAQRLGVRAQVLPEALSHRQINDTLGLPGAYTAAVDRFLASVDPAWR